MISMNDYNIIASVRNDVTIITIAVCLRVA